MYAELKGGSFSRGGTFDTSYVQTDTAMVFNPKYYWVSATLYGTDGVLNRGPVAAMSYVENKMINAAGKMAKLIAVDAFLDGQGVTSSITAIDGFAAAIDNGNTYPSYGGITRSDIATGNNNGINAYVATVPTMSLTAMQAAYGACWFGNEHVDLILMTQAEWDIFWLKLQPQQRFNEESSDIARAGFQSLRYNGATLAVDQYCPAGTIWLLNTKYLYFYISTLPLWQFGFTGWKEAPNNVDAVGQYLFSGNLVNGAPRLMAQINGVTG